MSTRHGLPRTVLACLSGVLIAALFAPIRASGPGALPPAEPVPGPGYHHLGATTADGWTGVTGRLTVADPGVRAGTFDFVAARFMARNPAGTAWLEAGWSENGWLRDGRQRIYTYDTASRRWTFFDEYRTGPGDQIWVYLESSGNVWRAWLWWHDDWHLLAETELPIGPSATVEQYVEVYVDPAKGGSVALPPSSFDNVQLRDAAGGFQYWREPVATGVGESAGTYCLDWHTRFDTWSAGTC
jgi:hypothetical protein